MFRIRLKFTKEDPVKYLGHLDMMKLLERAVRRAELPVVFSQGFCPKMKLSVAWPLSVGMTSLGEYADIVLTKWVAQDKIAPLLNSVLPTGCRISDASLVNLKQKSLTEQVSAAKWYVEVNLHDVIPAKADISQYLIEKTPDKKIYEMTLPAGPKKNVRVQDLFPKTAQIERVELLL